MTRMRSPGQISVEKTMLRCMNISQEFSLLYVSWEKATKMVYQTLKVSIRKV